MLEHYYKLSAAPAAIWSVDFDICVVLDGLRVDAWKNQSGLYFRTSGESAWSVGSCSPEWYSRTFHPDVVPRNRSVGVVTANPFAKEPATNDTGSNGVPLHRNDGVERVDYVFDDEWGCVVEESYLDVTHPGVVTDRAWEHWNEWDVDHLVIHYMQPHLPFRSTPDWFSEDENQRHFREFGAEFDPKGSIWRKAASGEISAADLWHAYMDNVCWGLQHVERLYSAIDGSILVTSDHGNAFGEWGVWGHPPAISLPAVRRVPFELLEAKGGGDFTTRSYESGESLSASVGEKLAALGYY